MDEKENLNNNLQNPNQQDLNNSANNQINNVENPYIQNTEDNPYYNPYFQNTDLGDPSFNGSDINVNNDIYNQAYMGNNNMDINSTETYNNSQVDATNIQEDSNMTQSSASNMQESSRAASEDSINLFNMSESNSDENSDSSVMSDTNNNINANGMENETIDTTMHVNPILSPNINNSNFEPTQYNNQVDNLNNSQLVDNNQFNNTPQFADNNQFNNNPQFVDNNQFGNNSSQNVYGNNNDEEFKKSWMGKLYDKANNRKFNIPAFFFGGFYYLYRKLYLFGFIFTILSCLISILGIYTTLINIGNSSSIILPLLLTIVLPIVLAIVYGFAFYPLYKGNVNKKLAKYKNEVQNPAQLVDTAKQNGGTSIPFVLLGILLNGVISSIALTTIMASLISNFVDGFMDGLSSPTNNINTNNLINNSTENDVIYDIYNFYEDYYFEYDASKWLVDEDNKLTYDNYTFSYIQSIEALSSVGFDISQNDGRSSFFTYLYNLFSSQIDAQTTTLELGSSLFVYENGIYYSYFDLVYTTSIERCYFVLIPESDIFIEFILSNADTVVADDIHNEVISYICSIINEPTTQTSGKDSNSIDSDVANGINSNMVSLPTSNSNNVTSQNNATNSVNNVGIQTSNNTINDNLNEITTVSNTTVR